MNNAVLSFHATTSLRRRVVVVPDWQLYAEGYVMAIYGAALEN